MVANVIHKVDDVRRQNGEIALKMIFKIVSIPRPDDFVDPSVIG